MDRALGRLRIVLPRVVHAVGLHVGVGGGRGAAGGGAVDVEVAIGGGGTAVLTNGYGILGSPYNTTVPRTFSVDTSLIANITYVNNYFNDTGVTQSVLSIVNSAPTSPVNGTYYLIGTAPTGIFTGHQNQIAQSVGSGWSYTSGVTGQLISIASLGGAIYLFNGTNWVAQKKPVLREPKGKIPTLFQSQ